MKEYFTFIIYNKYATTLIPSSQLNRKYPAIATPITVQPTDELYELIKAQHNFLQRKMQKLFTQWSVTRKYSKSELQDARYFRLIFKKWIDTAGSEFGTKYSIENACSICGAGAEQLGPLIFSPTYLNKKTTDVLITLGAEVLLSDRARSIIEKPKLRGFEFSNILAKRDALIIKGYNQLHEPKSQAAVSADTIVSEDPFTPSEKDPGMCPNGDRLGSSLISELVLNEAGIPTQDIFVTEKYFGYGCGQSESQRVWVISKRAYDIFQKYKLTGLQYEIAHVTS